MMARRQAAISWRSTGGALLAAGLVAGMMPQAAAAQADERLSRIETQLRALQRAVFPGGDERFFEPEITAPQGGQPAAPGATGSTAVSASALTDVLARLDAIEMQLARLTAATEVNQNAVALLQGRIDVLEAGAAATTAGAVPAATPSGPVLAGNATVAGAAPTPTATPTPGPAQTPAGTRVGGSAAQVAAAAPSGAAATTPAAAAASPPASRVAAVQAILKPATDDAGDDEYVYGFRLWDAGFYPEAQQQLALFLERHPGHMRTSFARNLLGRAYLDAGDARRAATFFFENYQADKNAARAPDSLLFLAESMIQLNDTRRACIALAEFSETYPALAAGRLAQQLATVSGRVDCE